MMDEAKDDEVKHEQAEEQKISRAILSWTSESSGAFALLSYVCRNNFLSGADIMRLSRVNRAFKAFHTTLLRSRIKDSLLYVEGFVTAPHNNWIEILRTTRFSDFSSDVRKEVEKSAKMLREADASKCIPSTPFPLGILLQNIEDTEENNARIRKDLLAFLKAHHKLAYVEGKKLLKKQALVLRLFPRHTDVYMFANQRRYEYTYAFYTKLIGAFLAHPEIVPAQKKAYALLNSWKKEYESVEKEGRDYGFSGFLATLGTVYAGITVACIDGIDTAGAIGWSAAYLILICPIVIILMAAVCALAYGLYRRYAPSFPRLALSASMALAIGSSFLFLFVEAVLASLIGVTQLKYFFITTGLTGIYGAFLICLYITTQHYSLIKDELLRTKPVISPTLPPDTAFEAEEDLTAPLLASSVAAAEAYPALTVPFEYIPPPLVERPLASLTEKGDVEMDYLLDSPFAEEQKEVQSIDFLRPGCV